MKKKSQLFLRSPQLMMMPGGQSSSTSPNNAHSQQQQQQQQRKAMNRPPPTPPKCLSVTEMRTTPELHESQSRTRTPTPTTTKNNRQSSTSSQALVPVIITSPNRSRGQPSTTTQFTNNINNHLSVIPVSSTAVSSSPVASPLSFLPDLSDGANTTMKREKLMGRREVTATQRSVVVNPTAVAVNKYIEREIAAVRANNDDGADRNSQQHQHDHNNGSSSDIAAGYNEIRVYREAMNLMITSLPSFGGVLERIRQGYDSFIELLERRDDSVAAAKDKAYDEFRCMFEQHERLRVQEHDQLLQRIRGKEREIEGRHKDHADHLKNLKSENERLKLQVLDDHDRCLALSQSVVELRLSLQRAEYRAKEYDDLYTKHVDSIGKLYEFVKECSALARACKSHGIIHQLSLTPEAQLMLVNEATLAAAVAVPKHIKP
eukprot:PhM_4_TR13346/c7_g1_i1/m.69136